MFQIVHTKLKAQGEGFEGFSLSKNKTLCRHRRNVAEITPRYIGNRPRYGSGRTTAPPRPRWGRFDEQMVETRNVAGRPAASREISVFMI